MCIPRSLLSSRCRWDLRLVPLGDLTPFLWPATETAASHPLLTHTSRKIPGTTMQEFYYPGESPLCSTSRLSQPVTPNPCTEPGSFRGFPLLLRWVLRIHCVYFAGVIYPKDINLSTQLAAEAEPVRISSSCTVHQRCMLRLCLSAPVLWGNALHGPRVVPHIWHETVIFHSIIISWVKVKNSWNFLFK